MVRARIPQKAQGHVTGLRWLRSLLDLQHPAGGDRPSEDGTFGEHFSVAPANGGYLASTSSLGTDVILPVRSIPLPAQEPQTAPLEKGDALPISFEALGGAREIGANSYYYRFGHRGLLIDAGFDANRDGWLGLPALERITRLDAIILTHAHLDHVGAMPVILAAFPKAPVYCTRATLAVLFPQLNDSAKVGQIRFEETGELPSFNQALADNLPLSRLRILSYGQRTTVPEIPGLSIQFADAGHIIGSAGAYLEFGDITILHTGDISVEDQHLLRGMRTDERVAHHVIVEGTYCGEPQFSREQRRAATDEFLSSIKERLDAGGSVLIPAFSLGRAQELVGLLVDWMDRTKRDIPIWTVGLVNVLNDVSAAHPEFLPKMSGNPFARVRRFPSPFSKELTNEQRRDEYGRIFFEIANKAPSIVIASHGMMAQNTGSYLIGRAILTGEDPRHGICLCGYMDPRAPGFRLRHQVQEPVIDYGIGDSVTRTIPPERVSYFRLTAHASYEELMEVALRIPTRSITFIHGEGEGLDHLRADLLKRYEALGRQMPVRVPAIGERVLLDRTAYPSNWTDEPFATELEQESLGPGRKFIQQTGLSVRGLTEDKRWALIRIGATSAVLALEHDHISSSRIEAVELRPQRGNAVMAYNREQAIGNLARIEWSEPGPVTWAIWARDPGDTLVPSELRVFYGTELRPVRSSVSAGSAVLEVEIGGASYAPQFQALTLGEKGSAIKTGAAEWDPAARILSIPLLDCTKVSQLNPSSHLSRRHARSASQPNLV
jgi:predicted metal-dependent RNase